MTEARIEGLGAETTTEVTPHHAFGGHQRTSEDILRDKTYSKLEMSNGQNLGVKVRRNSRYPLIC